MKFSSALLTLLAAVAVTAAPAGNETSETETYQAKSAVICGLDEERSVSCSHHIKDDVSTTPMTTVPFPKMPEKLHALIKKDWDALDVKGEEMMATLKEIDAAVMFAHARSTFYEHLQGTFGILAAWGLPPVITRTGLVHTAYSGDLFQFYLFDANKQSDRAELRGILGEEAEALTYLFGTVNRGGLCDFAKLQNGTVTRAAPPVAHQTVHHRTVGEWAVSPIDAANILMVTIADYLDQMVETNGWRDHHQIDEGASVLYPGDGKPAVALYWFASVCNGIKDTLDVVPPIFNYCTELLTIEDETKARDAYWNAVQHEKSLTEAEQIVLFYDAISFNPYIAEPHMMLSQIFYRQGQYYQAAVEARAALEKMYILCSAWDKRRSYEHWVGFTRILLLRANRKLEKSTCHLPCTDEHNPLYINYNDLKLTSLPDLVQEFADREE